MNALITSERRKSLRDCGEACGDRIPANGPDGTYSSGQSFVPERMNVIADEVEVLSSSDDGLTMDVPGATTTSMIHIPQRDYYRLSAISRQHTIRMTG
jgi:hypothetical protein